VHTCNACIQEVEAGGMQIQGHPGLHSKTLSQIKKRRKEGQREEGREGKRERERLKMFQNL
jgi:hypothetical protein